LPGIIESESQEGKDTFSPLKNPSENDLNQEIQDFTPPADDRDLKKFGGCIWRLV